MSAQDPPSQLKVKHIHLDPLGGVAGDMFIAAIIDAFPDFAEEMIAAVSKAAGVKCGARDYIPELARG